MDHLFKMGKDLLMNGGNSSSSSSKGSFDVMGILKQFDKNGDGKITEEDFVLAIKPLGLGSIGETSVRTVFRQIDKNNNGILELNEAIGAYEALMRLFNQQKPQHKN
jgi:Ca2+-binding EF-hand superfamily protein